MSTKVRDAIFGNVGTMINFRVGATDAEFLETQYTPDLLPQDLVNIPNRNVYIRLMVDGFSSRVFSASTLPPIVFEKNPEFVTRMLENSRRLYGRPRKEVEDMILRWSSMDMAGDRGRYEAPPRREQFDRPPMGAQSSTPNPNESQPAPRAMMPAMPQKPHYATNLADLGIDTSEERPRGPVQTPMQQIVPQRPPEVSLDQLRKRPRNRGRGGRGGQSPANPNALRETLRQALGQNLPSDHKEDT
jgi:hypothetical protein